MLADPFFMCIFGAFSSLFPLVLETFVKIPKKMILIIKQHAKHLFASQNTQLALTLNDWFLKYFYKQMAALTFFSTLSFNCIEKS